MTTRGPETPFRPDDAADVLTRLAAFAAELAALGFTVRVDVTVKVTKDDDG